jgi:hypothetical protein
MPYVEIELEEFSTGELLDELSYRTGDKKDRKMIIEFLSELLDTKVVTNHKSMSDVMKDEVAILLLKYLTLEQLEECKEKYAPGKVI